MFHAASPRHDSIRTEPSRIFDSAAFPGRETIKMAPPTRGAAGLRVERSGPAIAAWQRRRAILRGAIGAGWLHFNTASLNIYIIYISELAFISLVNESKLPGTAYT
jgi:hypothetical protein